ncbi:MAG: 30S ribosomal protein S8 [Candidatus Undinarchaeales archaeon]
MLNEPLSNALVNIKNNEEIGKPNCRIKPASNLIKAVLQSMQDEGYIAGFEYVDNGKGGEFKVNLVGKINKCRAIRPRLPVKVSDIERYEKVYLPGKGFGTLILSTPHGVMTHEEAKEKKTGGVLLSYVY